MRKRKKAEERGSLTVEAVLFLIPFLCAFLTLVNMARFVQAEMLIHHAITQTAKGISVYSYVLTKTKVTEAMQNTGKKSSQFIKDTNEAVNSVGELTDAIGNVGGGGNLIDEVDEVASKAQNAEEVLTNYFSDSKALMSGAMAVAKHEGSQLVLRGVAGGISKSCIRESILKISDDPDEFLKNIGIVDGMSGLDFSGSKWIPNTEGKVDIEIVVTFRMKNLLFPDFDFGEHEFCLCASTIIW